MCPAKRLGTGTCRGTIVQEVSGDEGRANDDVTVVELSGHQAAAVARVEQAARVRSLTPSSWPARRLRSASFIDGFSLRMTSLVRRVSFVPCTSSFRPSGASACGRSG